MNSGVTKLDEPDPRVIKLEQDGYPPSTCFGYSLALKLSFIQNDHELCLEYAKEWGFAYFNTHLSYRGRNYKRHREVTYDEIKTALQSNFKLSKEEKKKKLDEKMAEYDKTYIEFPEEICRDQPEKNVFQRRYADLYMEHYARFRGFAVDAADGPGSGIPWLAARDLACKEMKKWAKTQEALDIYKLFYRA